MYNYILILKQDVHQTVYIKALFECNKIIIYVTK
jgi:hypothetical protein